MPGEMRYFRPRSTAVGVHTQEMLQRDRREMRCLAPAIRRVALKRSTEKTRMAAAAYIAYYYYLARASATPPLRQPKRVARVPRDYRNGVAAAAAEIKLR